MIRNTTEAQISSQQYSLKTFYDSFDWRLYRAGYICELSRSQQSSQLTLMDRKSQEGIASTAILDIPAFAAQFNPGKVRKILEPVLEMRALLAVCTLECERYLVDVFDPFDNVIAVLDIESYELLNSRLTIHPKNNHEKEARQFAQFLVSDIGLEPTDKSVLNQALRLHGRNPKDYTAKLKLNLEPDMSAEVAIKRVFKELLRVLKLNEQGLIADTDSEFLHDFRVAVRKTRVALNQFDGILPESSIAKYKGFFAWLGQITGETRDYDVYLLKFDGYKQQLPSEFRQSINPLYPHILTKKQKSHHKMARKLKTAKYLKTLTDWENFISSSAQNSETHPMAEELETIKNFAGERIWKAYKKTIKQGQLIDNDSPPEMLHQLRKTCKKLRYLLEFFNDLYPEKKMEKLIKSMKGLQEVLGDFQDYAVQQAHLQQYSEELQAINTPNKTFLAIGILIQDFEQRKTQARDHFADHFDKFDKNDTQKLFQELFKPGKRKSAEE